MARRRSCHDVEDVVALADQCQYLVIATKDDRWSRGVEEVRRRLAGLGAHHARVELRPGAHEFAAETRAEAYAFLATVLG